MTRKHTRSLIQLGLVGVVAGVLLVAACRGPGTQTVEITASDYAFQNVPATVGVGTKFTVVNRSAAELHEVVALRIPDSETRPVAQLLQLPEAEQRTIVEEPSFVIIAPPNADGMAVLGDGTFTEPGRYALVCFIPTGADPQAYMAAAQQSSEGPPQVPGGPPHVAHGMFAEVRVQ
ncbi:MAG: hypothetical protein GEU73_16085 [Chloroflexi bacterium]|nr:hypothetical protein [Chloroflexota bacterium]